MRERLGSLGTHGMYAIYIFVCAHAPTGVCFDPLIHCVADRASENQSRRKDSKAVLVTCVVSGLGQHPHLVHLRFVLGLFVAAQLLPRLTDSLGVKLTSFRESALSAKPLALLFVACLLATLIGPYDYHLYMVVLSYSQAHYAYKMINELQPLSFRISNHFFRLLLAGSGFVAIAWLKKIDLFELTPLTFASVVGFRTLRNCWFLAITPAAFIADFPAAQEAEEETWLKHGAILLTLAFFVVLLSLNFGFNERNLDRMMSEKFPVDAANFLRRNPLPGPLYNNLDWGGFLIWYMPQYPLAIDGRNDLFGDDLDRTFHKAQSALQYKDDPYLNKAGCGLLEKSTLSPRFSNLPRGSMWSTKIRTQ